MGLIGVVLAFLPTGGFDHIVRAWLMGFMICFGFAVGGLALLMVQHLTGGKWGLVVRRPLEAMARTLPLVFLFFIPVGIFVKRLYPWAKFSDVAAALQADALGRPLLDVFKIVNEDTRKLVESPVSKALRMGCIVGLANHTILIAKDGTEFEMTAPSEGSCPPNHSATNAPGSSSSRAALPASFSGLRGGNPLIA